MARAGFSSGLGYLDDVQEVEANGRSTVTVRLHALRGNSSAPDYTLFECRVTGEQARSVLAQLRDALQSDEKVLIGFTVDAPEITGRRRRTAAAGRAIRAKLLRIGLARVNGRMLTFGAGEQGCGG